MERWRGRVALVTGASVGIGAEICRELVRHGMTVVGCARNLQKIQEIAEADEVKAGPGKLHCVRCDLTKESDIVSMFQEVRSKFGHIDVLINNAGFSTDSPLLSGENSDWRAMLEVNVLALCICTKEAVKLMKERGIDDGQIIHISSVGGHRLPAEALFGFNFYCGTKFMVRAITEGLRREVRAEKSHIRVATISPGMVETKFLERAFDETQAKIWYSSMKCLQSKDIADAVVYILGSPPHVDVNDIVVQPVEQS